MATLEKEVCALRDAFFTAPDFGIAYTHEEADKEGAGLEGGGGRGGGTSSLAAGSEDVEIVTPLRVDPGGKEAEWGSGGDAYAAYLAEGNKTGDRQVVYSAEIGLAVEAPPAGMSLKELWETL